MKHVLGMGKQDAKLRWGPNHLNSDMIVALDIRVGGEQPYNSDLLEVCFMPLNHSYKPHPEFAPFNIRIRPDFDVDNKIAGIDKQTLKTEHVMPADQVCNLLEAWWSAIRAKPSNKMCILCWDWPTKKPWIEHWLTGSYSELIAESYRDSLPLLNFVNDRSDYRGEEVTYKQPTFSQLVTRSGYKLIARNSLMANCLALSESYRFILHQR